MQRTEPARLARVAPSIGARRAGVGSKALSIACAVLAAAALATAPGDALAQDAVQAASLTAMLSIAPTSTESAASTLFEDVGTGLKIRSAQTRARQARLNDVQSTRVLPQFESALTISDDQKSAPLRPKDRPGVAPGKLAPSSIGRINSYLNGDLHSSQSIDNSAGLSTSALTMGADYRFDEHLMVGLAASRLQTAHTAGSTLSAYTTVQPADSLFVDIELSYGAHRSRVRDDFPLDDEHSQTAAGTSRALSVQLNHPGRIGKWTVSPFSRYEAIQTELESSGGVQTGSVQNLSAIAIGSTLGTTLGTPFGTVRPQLLVEIQRESRSLAGGAPVMQTQGTLGLGIATKVTRELSAFAESRFEQEVGANAELRALLGIRLAF